MGGLFHIPIHIVKNRIGERNKTDPHPLKKKKVLQVSGQHRTGEILELRVGGDERSCGLLHEAQEPNPKKKRGQKNFQA